MGTILSVPNKSHRGEIPTDKGSAVISFNANSCKKEPSGVFQLRIKDLGLRVKAGIVLLNACWHKGGLSELWALCAAGMAGVTVTVVWHAWVLAWHA